MASLYLLCIFFLAFVCSLLLPASCDLAEERVALLDFISNVPHESRLSWSTNATTCSWVGVKCDDNQTAVIALRLPGVGLVGPIPPNTLSRLINLRVISLRSNALSGPIPTNLFSNLTLLRSLYLQDNRFSGQIPDSVLLLGRLARLDLSENGFRGTIPFGFNNLTRLTGLFLQGNGFQGKIPSIDIPSLVSFNVSDNKLNGSIPKSLEKFPLSSFSGNLQLCGNPLPECAPFFAPPAPSPADEVPPNSPKKKKKLSKAAIIAISVVGGVLLLSLLLILLFCLIRHRRSRNGSVGEKKVPRVVTGQAVMETGTTSSDIGIGGEKERSKLVFFDNRLYSFDLEDLLRASAEVLGKGIAGTSYKAVLEDGTTVVVKRLKDVVASKREYEVQLEILGKVNHDNIVPLRAYYYSKDEKLLVSDYLPNGSLSAFLHGSRASGKTALDWDNRIRIALATGRGLAHLHRTSQVVHGNIKSSNVLLRPDPDSAALSDFGLSPLFGMAGPACRASGYRAPELLDTRKATDKSDVYSFGVLLLELLTGKAPNQTTVGEETIDLTRWVQSVVKEEWTAEVFDVELVKSGDQNTEEEMVQLLQIAMACVNQIAESRPEIESVVKMIEEIASLCRGEVEDSIRQSSDDRSNGPTPPAAVTP